MRFLFQAPPSYEVDRTYPLWLVLHGAFARAEQAIMLFGQQALAQNTFLLAPEASRHCGDGFCWSFALDAQSIDHLLATLRASYPIDPARLFIIGYSMGCTMGLWLIARNPGLFAGFAALGLGSAFEPWEHDDGGIDHSGLGQSAARTRVLLAVDQADPAGTNHYFEDNLARLQGLGLEVETFRPNAGTHEVTQAMKAVVLHWLASCCTV